MRSTALGKLLGGSLQQVDSCRVGNETGGRDVTKQNDRRKSTCS